MRKAAFAGKLTDAIIAQALDDARQSGCGVKLGDGRGLVLNISVNGDAVRASWVHIYQRGGRRREMGLGSLQDCSLVEARQKRDASSRALSRGDDPIDERDALMEFERRKAQEPSIRSVMAFLKKSADLFVRSQENLHEYPAPPAPLITQNSLAKLPQYGGVYFLWANSKVEYVGRATNLRTRLTNHHVFQKFHRVSYLEFPRGELFWAECFYIGALRPPLNRMAPFHIKGDDPIAELGVGADADGD